MLEADRALAGRCEAPGTTSVDNWDRHWSDFGDALAASPAREFRHRILVGLLAANGPPARLLDIGSGSGDLAARIRRAFPSTEILGLELSRVGVEQALHAVPDATFLQRDLLEPHDPGPAHRAWATHAVCSEVLEHVDEPDRLLANAIPYLASGCRLLVTVPGGPMSAFDRHIGHRRHFTPASLRAVLEDAGFRAAWVRGAGFPFFNLYRLVVVARGPRLEKDVSAGARGASSLLARALMKVFGVLFRLSSNEGQRGWQLVASAVLPDGPSTSGSRESA